MPSLRPLVSALAFSLTSAFAAHAECRGQNLFDEMPPDRLAVIEAATDAVPYPSGNFWQATRGDEVITIAGTYHMDDPRHAANLSALTPHIQAATTVLVEAGPEEEATLMALLARDPAIMVITTGPTLMEQLPPEVWEPLAKAMSDRGIPAFMAAKFRPWYVIATLSIPPCLVSAMTDEPKGLDGLVIDTALAANVPIRALEPFDTIFGIFDRMTEAELIAMIQSALALEDQAEDQFATLADSYFAGEARRVWELMRQVSYDLPGETREKVDAEFLRMEELLMNERNRAWIPVLTGTAKEGPVFAAFGAMHLSGDAGVLNLLEQEGYDLKPLTLP